MKKQFMNEYIMHSGNEIMKQQQTQNFKRDVEGEFHHPMLSSIYVTPKNLLKLDLNCKRTQNNHMKTIDGRKLTMEMKMNQRIVIPL